MAVYLTSDGHAVGSEHPGPKIKVADSRKEYARRCQLIAELRAGTIQALDCQKTFVLHGLDGRPVCRLILDFVYVRGGKRIAEDVKPMRKVKRDGQWLLGADGKPLLKPFATPVYFLKKKLLKSEYGITVVEV